MSSVKLMQPVPEPGDTAMWYTCSRHTIMSHHSCKPSRFMLHRLPAALHMVWATYKFAACPTCSVSSSLHLPVYIAAIHGEAC